jgi:predicted protein tyrosine phosphatase
MPRIHVCSLAQLQATVRQSGATSMITLINRNTPVERPDTINPGRHLIIGLSDIVAPVEGQILAQEEHVAGLIGFIRDWDRAWPIVIHCYAGVSRSTAAAFIALCALKPGHAEDALAHRLRTASPTATPNPRLVELADCLLERRGRMVAAIASIGRGAECFEGTPFALELE